MIEEVKTRISVGKDDAISLEVWVEQHLQIAENYAHLNAFVHIFRQQALADAQRIDLEIASGRKKVCYTGF